MGRRTLFAATLLCGLSVVAAEKFPETVKAYPLSKGRPAAVDGDLGDWDASLFRRDFLTIDSRAPSKREFAFAARHDERTLHLAFRAAGPVRGVGKAPAKDGDIWKDADVIEVFFGKADGGHGYRQFAVSADGGLFDAMDGDGFVNFAWTGKVRRDGSGWTAEMSIPFSELGMGPALPGGFRMNLSMYLAGGESVAWSLRGGKGFRDEDDMGYVVFGSFEEAAKRQVGEFRRRNGARPSVSVKAGTEVEYRAFMGALADEESALAKERMERAAAAVASVKCVPHFIVMPWDEDGTFTEDRAFQTERLVAAVKGAGRRTALAFTNAVNETTHRAFTISAVQKDETVSLSCFGLKGSNGGYIRPDRIYVARARFLHTPPDFAGGRQAHPDVPWPELVERVTGPEKIEVGTSGLFRLYVDTTDTPPGDYSGALMVSVSNLATRLQVTCHVRGLTLPKPETHPFPVYLFTTVPFGGESAELCADFFRRHYVTDVSFEHPDVFVDGKLVPDFRDNANGWTNYLHRMLTYRTPPGARVTFDFAACALGERLAACGRHGLRIEISNRSGHILADHIPAMVREFGRFGIAPSNIVYKLGDEDHSPLFLPVAKRIRELAPGIEVAMIPAGNSWWDISVLAEGFTALQFSRAAFRLGERGDRDMAYLRSRGVKVSRYLNDAAWAGRTLPHRARAEPWAALVLDGLDGYACWTGCVWPRNKYRTGYGTNPRYTYLDLPPERQWGTQLVYYRKVDGVFRPLSCRRLEDIRDGLIDALYHRLAAERLRVAGDEAGLARLKEIAVRPKTRYADYESARAEMAALAASAVELERQTVKRR